MKCSGRSNKHWVTSTMFEQCVAKCVRPEGIHVTPLLPSLSFSRRLSLPVVIWGHHVGDRHAGPDSIPWGWKQWDLWLLEAGKPSQTASRLSGQHVSVASFAAHSSQNTLSWWASTYWNLFPPDCKCLFSIKQSGLDAKNSSSLSAWVDAFNLFHVSWRVPD